ncbi:hypothetical protein [Microbacterium hydrocarbonoxydans]|uniref:hypothetical protein n=1 Tax=Microbacterium hydrocarbonoxydans TaxID=273678 RepID=UPI00203FC2AA|nr:hypothetical protein [Microbacterium hydrocarbonoxydans]MCM3779966.1 hypothetical protein [Microbacterium hydrocarbonoxydans]
MTISRAAVGAGLAIALAAGAALAAAPAWAAPSTEVVQGAVLRIVSVADWDEAADLLPGESVVWDVAVSADADVEPGTVTLAVSATGAAPLLVDAELCLQPWADGACPGGATVLTTSWTIPRDGSEAVLADFPSTQTAHLRLRLARGGDDDRPGFTDVRVSARGVGDAVAAGPGGGLPTTGGTAPVGVLVGGIALVGAGAVLLAERTRLRGRGRPVARGYRGARDGRDPDAGLAP